MPPVSKRPPCTDCGCAAGTNRYDCKVCNRFVSRVTRAANRELRDNHPTETVDLHDRLERELYEGVYGVPWDDALVAAGKKVDA